jgi:antitoxin PrlF
MATASLTSKGQITIPIEVREDLGLKTGDKISFIKNERGEYVLKPKTGSVMNLLGMFKAPEKPVTLEEMNESVGKHLAEDDARIMREYARYARRGKSGAA